MPPRPKMDIKTIKINTENIELEENGLQSPRHQVALPLANLPESSIQEEADSNVSQGSGANDMQSKSSEPKKHNEGDDNAQTTPAFITQVSQKPGLSAQSEEARKRLAKMKIQAASKMQPNQNQKIPEKKSPSLFEILCCCIRPAAHEEVPLKPVSTVKPINSQKVLLPPVAPQHINKKCLVLDLDETLVHSSFKPVANSDFTIDVEIDNIVHQVYVLKRPHANRFLEVMSEHFEVVVFTASLSKYADPVLDRLDQTKAVQHRLFREHCVHYNGNYIKDLSLLGRDLKDVIIIDNSPTCYMFQPQNAIPITSWFDDMTDEELQSLIPFLEDLKNVENVTTILDTGSIP